MDYLNICKIVWNKTSGTSIGVNLNKRVNESKSLNELVNIIGDFSPCTMCSFSIALDTYYQKINKYRNTGLYDELTDKEIIFL